MNKTSTLRWASILLVIFASVIVGIYFALSTHLIQDTILAISAVMFIGALFLVVPIYLLSAFTDSSQVIDALLSSLLKQTQKHPGIMLWPAGIATFVFIPLSALWIISIFQLPPDESIKTLQLTTKYEVISFLIMIFFWSFYFLSRIDSRIPISDKITTSVSLEMIQNNPQAATEYTFTIFEDYLRKQINAPHSSYGEPLINEALAPKKGKIIFGSVENETLGFRNLVSGVYATFRNPRKHRIVNDSPHTATILIAFIGLIMDLIEEVSQKTLSKDFRPET